MSGVSELPVPPFEIFKIHGETQGDGKVQTTAPSRPTVAVRRVAEFPKPKKNKKHHGAGNENFVGGKKFHLRFAQQQTLLPQRRKDAKFGILFFLPLRLGALAGDNPISFFAPFASRSP